MNWLLISIVLLVALFSWMLAGSLRSGEFRFTSRWSEGDTLGRRVTRSEHPIVFWMFAAFHVWIILYMASLAFTLESSAASMWRLNAEWSISGFS